MFLEVVQALLISTFLGVIVIRYATHKDAREEKEKKDYIDLLGRKTDFARFQHYYERSNAVMMTEV